MAQDVSMMFPHFSGPLPETRRAREYIVARVGDMLGGDLTPPEAVWCPEKILGSQKTLARLDAFIDSTGPPQLCWWWAVPESVQGQRRPSGQLTHSPMTLSKRRRPGEGFGRHPTTLPGGLEAAAGSTAPEGRDQNPSVSEIDEDVSVKCGPSLPPDSNRCPRACVCIRVPV
eukprot:Hpha_TRINITY_DN10663_c0_g4::TRINITY_DN10663_c0_g4_i1::g.156578::m.156578